MTFPGVEGPLKRMSVPLTSCHAVAAFCTSQTESMWHLGSSSTRFDWVPEAVRTALGDPPVSQNQRQRQGVSSQPSPGSRPPRFAHLERTVPDPSPPASEGSP